MVFAQKPPSIPKFALAKIWTTCDDDPCWLSGCMRINDMKALER